MVEPPEYRPLRARARFAKLGIAFATAVGALGAVDRVSAGAITADFGYPSPGGLMGAAFATLVFALVGPMLFLAWLHRACRNVAAHGRELSFSPGEAVFAWFVPILNLVRPYQIVGELDRAASPDPAGSTALDVHAWWVLWIGSFAIGLLGALDPSASGQLLVEGSWVLTRIGCAVIAIRIIDRITERIEGAGGRPLEF